MDSTYRANIAGVGCRKAPGRFPVRERTGNVRFWTFRPELHCGLRL